jgi:hypothetical protein
MMQMIWRKAISDFLRRLSGKDPSRMSYWELEGLCIIERPPTIIGPGGLVGSTLTQREYCVRR